MSPSAKANSCVVHSVIISRVLWGLCRYGSTTSAYMLVYVRAQDIQQVRLVPNTKKSVQNLFPPVSCSDILYLEQAEVRRIAPHMYNNGSDTFGSCRILMVVLQDEGSLQECIPLWCTPCIGGTLPIPWIERVPMRIVSSAPSGKMSQYRDIPSSVCDVRPCVCVPCVIVCVCPV